VLLDGAHRATEGGGHLGLRQVGQVAERHHFALAPGERLQHLDQLAPLRDQRARRVVDRRRPDPARRARGAQARGAPPPSFGAAAGPDHPEGQIGGHPCHPGLVVRADPAPPGEGPGQRLLGEVLGLVPIAQDPVADAVGERAEDGRTLVEVRTVPAHHLIQRVATPPG
jgi:hypothetical protein